MHHSKSIYTAFSRIKAHLFVKSIWEGEKRRNSKIRDNTQICWCYSEIKNKLKKQKKVQNSNTGCEWNTRILFHAHKTFQLNTLWLASYYKIQLYWGFSLCTFLVLFEWWTRFLLWERFFRIEIRGRDVTISVAILHKNRYSQSSKLVRASNFL